MWEEFLSEMREDRPQMDTRTLLRERLRRSRDWTQTIDELEKELEGSGTKPEQSERLFELAALVEDVIPERERALGLYQRAWKLHPDNLKALSRAREVYGEIGRYEMVAKLGEMELRSPHAAVNLPAIVGEALLDSGQKDKALPILQRALGAQPDSVRVKDALAAVTYDQEFWTDEVDRLSDEAERVEGAQAVRMLLRAARVLRIESADDPRLEELLKRIFEIDIDEPSANFIFETVLQTGNRWDELETHQLRRAERASDHGMKVESLRMFALEWVQRFKDKDRGAKFFGAALRANTSNGEAPMRSVVAAFSLLRQVQGDRGEWQQLLDLADAVIAKATNGEDKLFVAIQAGHIAFDKLDDVARAKRYFSIAASIEKDNPSVQDFASIAGPLDEVPLAAGSMSEIAAVKPPEAEAEAAAEAPEASTPNVEAQAPSGKKSKKERKAEEAAAKAEAEAAAKAQAAAEQATAEKAGARAAADQAAADQAAADQAAADQAAADHAAAGKAAADQVAADHAAAGKAAAGKAAADQAAADQAAAAKAAAAKAAADKEVPADLGAAMDKAKHAEGGTDKGVLGWKDVVAKFPAEKAPRRELARVLRQAQSWAQLADALKDEEAKASPSDPDKAAVFLELADTYSKLNNDNQVIAALNQAIHHDPNHPDTGGAAFDRLVALYEGKKRWPDLVKVLQEKAERAPASPGAGGNNQKVVIYLQVANLYLERFSNQAEAIKAFEKVLELDPNNAEAIDHLLAVYEKRRDW
ncbi:MAG: hypothetical protein ABI467_25870 [Kofleriaceae bacterium]